MAMYPQYMDLPQIPFQQDDTQYAGWTQDPTGYWYQSVHVGNSFDYNGMVNSDTMRKQAVERFLTDPSPLTTGLLHTKLYQSMTPQTPPYLQYEQWPRPVVGRYDSPDRTSVSGNSSYATQNEVRSPQYYSAVNSSPDQFTDPAFQYYNTGQMGDASSLPEVPLAAGSISLRDIELEHQSEPEPEPEPVIDEAEVEETKTDATCEQQSSHAKMDTTSDNYQDYSDSGVGSSLRDAESVQPMELSEEETSDADYTPNRSNKRRRSSASNYNSTRNGPRRRSHPGRKLASASTSHSNRVNKRKVNKRDRRAPTSCSQAKAPADADMNGDTRHFPCPLARYGCQSTFMSKNEWKRHVSTQHIKLGFWRCSLCTTSVDPHDERTVYHNDFNRKDLFSQHLRRMHAAPASQTIRYQKEYPVTDENIAHYQKHCFQILRSTPTRSCCLYCPETFSGPASWEERMEHIGRHLEKDGKAGLKLDDVASWNIDEELERWLLDEGIVALDKSGGWKIGDGRPKRRRSSGSCDEQSGDEEA